MLRFGLKVRVLDRPNMDDMAGWVAGKEKDTEKTISVRSGLGDGRW